jgi:hypothetical protein
LTQPLRRDWHGADPCRCNRLLAQTGRSHHSRTDALRGNGLLADPSRRHHGPAHTRRGHGHLQQTSRSDYYSAFRPTGYCDGTALLARGVSDRSAHQYRSGKNGCKDAQTEPEDFLDVFHHRYVLKR